jgi:hypothetical protein
VLLARVRSMMKMMMKMKMKMKKGGEFSVVNLFGILVYFQEEVLISILIIIFVLIFGADRGLR